MVRYLIYFSYIGTKFKGLQNLQKYPGQTIQGVLEDALQTLRPLNNPQTTTCSRTDKGVHAIKNAVHVDLQHPILKETFQPHRITERLNLFFTENDYDIIVNKTCIVPDTFHARHAEWRSYIYRLALIKPHLKEFTYDLKSYNEFLPIQEKDRCCPVHGSLNTVQVQEAAKLFLGTHDFSTFSKRLKTEAKDPLKTIYECTFYPLPDQTFFSDPQYENLQMWEFYIKADAYLYHQIRKMVGILLSVGYGFQSLHNVQKMLDEPSHLLWRKAVLPPACGLFLADIGYRDITTV